jgi:hypothetical protein
LLGFVLEKGKPEAWDANEYSPENVRDMRAASFTDSKITFRPKPFESFDELFANFSPALIKENKNIPHELVVLVVHELRICQIPGIFQLPSSHASRTPLYP